MFGNISTGQSLLGKELWFSYLQHPLQNELQIRHDNIVQHLEGMLEYVMKLVDWCIPNMYHNQDISNLPAALTINIKNTSMPCGYMQIFKKVITNKDLFKIIEVGPMFYITTLFLLFEMDGGEGCKQSKLDLLHHDRVSQKWFLEWSKCGTQIPWNMTSETNKIGVWLQQQNVQSVPRLCVMYYAVDFHLARKLLLESKIHTHAVALQFLATTNHTLTRSYAEEIQQWIIHVNIGSVIRYIAIKQDNDQCDLNIYDGPGAVQSTNLSNLFFRESNSTRRVAIVTRYFNSRLLLKCTKVILLRKIIIQYQNIKLKTVHLPMGSRTTIDSSKTIIQYVYSLKPGKGGGYANVSLEFRQFQGWNGGGCNYGGYLIKQYIGDRNMKPNYLGPFCSKDPNNDIRNHGLSYFIMNKYTTHLYVYAYSPWFTLNIDIVVRKSLCEGALEPIFMMNWQHDSDPTDMFLGHARLNSAHFYLSHLYFTDRESRDFRISVKNIKGCFVIQSLSYIHNCIIHYQIIKHALFNLKYQPAPAYYVNIGYHNKRAQGLLNIQTIDKNQIVTRAELQREPILIRHPVVFAALFIVHETGLEYEYASFTLEVLLVLVSNIPCAYVQTEREQSRTAISLINRCFIVVGRHLNEYVFSVAFSSGNDIYKQIIMYAALSREDCVADRNDLDNDVLTVIHNGTDIFHSVDFIIDFWKFQALSKAVTIQYIKKKQCRNVQFHFRLVTVVRRTDFFRWDNGLEYIQVMYTMSTESLFF